LEPIMKNAPMAIVCTALLGLSSAAALSPARACDMDIDGDHAHWAGHHDPGSARFAITTQDGKVTMLLTDRDVVLQLSDRTVHRVRRELQNKKDEQEDNWFAYAIVSAVQGTVGELIDNSVEIRVRDIRDASYEDGRLVFRGRNGKRVFEHADVDDSDVMSSFSEKDARAFVREFRKLKADD
jgi:hypothetical protein